MFHALCPPLFVRSKMHFNIFTIKNGKDCSFFYKSRDNTQPAPIVKLKNWSGSLPSLILSVLRQPVIQGRTIVKRLGKDGWKSLNVPTRTREAG